MHSYSGADLGSFGGRAGPGKGGSASIFLEEM